MTSNMMTTAGAESLALQYPTASVLDPGKGCVKCFVQLSEAAVQLPVALVMT